MMSHFSALLSNTWFVSIVSSIFATILFELCRRALPSVSNRLGAWWAERSLASLERAITRREYQLKCYLALTKDPLQFQAATMAQLASALSSCLFAAMIGMLTIIMHFTLLGLATYDPNLPYAITHFQPNTELIDLLRDNYARTTIRQAGFLLFSAAVMHAAFKFANLRRFNMISDYIETERTELRRLKTRLDQLTTR